MKKRLYITTAIDYVNSKPHIGTSYEKIGADAIARFYRLAGWDVHLQMGNDEHSTNVAKSAREQGLDPKAYCDHMEKIFRKAWDTLDIAYDGFVRTTSDAHAKSVTKLFEAIDARKAPDGSPNIFKGHYKGWYCDSCEAYYTEKDVPDKQCPVHGLPTRWLEEENYFFALSKYQDFLLQLIRRHPEFILPDVRRNEIVSLIESGLQDISISREGSNWGIHLPIDDRQTVYVWFDALINYITAVGYGDDPKLFKHWWEKGDVVHIIGKDITRFHCVIWPAMLAAAGITLPKTVFGHGFVTHGGQKMSKTLGNVVDPFALIERFGTEAVRYYMLREGSFGRDTDYTDAHFLERYNSDLANGIGNLVSRTLGMVHQYLEGTIPSSVVGRRSSVVETLIDTVGRTADKVERALDYRQNDLHFHDALAAIWEAIAAADKYINETKPWALQKAGKQEELAAVLAHVAATIRVIAVLVSPFLPSTAGNMWQQMGFAGTFGALRKQQLKDVQGAKACFTMKHPIAVGVAVALFPRIDPAGKEQPMKDVASRQSSVVSRHDNVLTEYITINEFAKVDLRVATITAVEKVEGADKLLRIQVDLGDEQRQIVAGIAHHYAPEALVGKQVCVVANLKPATLRGVESQGMLLAASGSDTVSILTPLKPVPNGTKVK